MFVTITLLYTTHSSLIFYLLYNSRLSLLNNKLHVLFICCWPKHIFFICINVFILMHNLIYNEKLVACNVRTVKQLTTVSNRFNNFSRTKVIQPFLEMSIKPLTWMHPEFTANKEGWHWKIIIWLMKSNNFFQINVQSLHYQSQDTQFRWTITT